MLANERGRLLVASSFSSVRPSRSTSVSHSCSNNSKSSSATQRTAFTIMRVQNCRETLIPFGQRQCEISRKRSHRKPGTQLQQGKLHKSWTHNFSPNNHQDIVTKELMIAWMLNSHNQDKEAQHAGGLTFSGKCKPLSSVRKYRSTPTLPPIAAASAIRMCSTGLRHCGCEPAALPCACGPSFTQRRHTRLSSAGPHVFNPCTSTRCCKPCMSPP
jgi:hypothetical protein